MKGMEVIIIDSEAYQKLKEELGIVIQLAVNEALNRVMNRGGPDAIWIRKEEAMKLLGIRSKSGLQKLRDYGKIEFTQHPGGRVILYNRKSILEYLDSHKKRRF